MKSSILFAKFDQALKWNSVLYFVHRLGKTLLTLLVFSKLSAQQFATWTHLFSFVYLFALWFDFGFRRSIPRYCPEFAHNAQARHRFLKRILLFQLSVLTLANITFIYNYRYISAFFGLNTQSWLLYLASMLFCAESFRSVLRLIYASYFWQKEFSLIDSSITIFSTFVLIGYSLIAEPSYLLPALIGTAIVSNALMIIIGLMILPMLLSTISTIVQKPIDEGKMTRQFAQHSCAMWLLIGINSLTERNVLVPFFSYSLGIHASNLFKVANDTALIFQRFIVKVIGVPTTALLSHVETEPHNRKKMKKSLAHFHKKLFILIGVVIIAIALVYVLMLAGCTHFVPSKRGLILGSQLFFILTFFYLLHLTMLGYSQLLSVKRCYKQLFISMLPYAALPIIAYAQLPLIPSIVAIHSIRILSFAIRTIYSKKIL